MGRARDSRPTRALWTARAVLDTITQGRFPFQPAAVIQRAQAARVGGTVAYAHAHVPYYRETMRRLILGPEDFRSAGDLTRLPLIEREQLQRDPEYFVSRRWPTEACVVLRSGGSTGEPVSVFRDPASFFAEGAHYERFRSIIGRLTGRRRYRQAVVQPLDSSSATTAAALQSRLQLPRNLRAEKRTFSMLRDPAELLPELNDYRPDVIESYGSYLEALFVYVGECRLRFAAPPVVVFGADSMSAEMRAWARNSLGVEVLGTYGAIEAPHIGFECERHRGYHLNVDLHPIRLLADDGGEAAAGTAGEIVVSNLVNRGTVLLNYHLGDMATAEPDACSCGRTLPLSAYLGRTKSAWIDFGDGHKIHAQTMRLVLRHAPEILRYQVVQAAERRLLIRLVPRPACDRPAVAERLLAGLSEQLPDGVALEVQFVADLPRGPSGKVQPIVTLTSAEARSARADR
jgi:phenylacetate-CoA ligase